MKSRLIQYIFALLVVFIWVALPLSAQDTASQPEETSSAGAAIPIWQTADDIRSALLNAQRELFAARRSDDPAGNLAAASAYVAEATTHYITTMQPDIQRYAAEQDQQIEAIFSSALGAAQAGDDAVLALARGRIWTGMLHGAYLTTLGALEANDTDTVAAWLSFREYRQATRVTVVLSPAAGALADVQSGVLTLEEAAPIIENDLRDAYYFRLRQAATELQTALETDYFTRAAEWLGQLEGYYAIFADDYAAQMGITSPADALAQIEDAVSVQDTSAALQALAIFREALTNYQPVALTEAQIAERGQLLYIFTDLVYVEYKDAVRNGEITVPIEYQEASTFLAQARSTFDELRPTIAAHHPEEAARLDAILAQLQSLLDSIGEIAAVQELVAEGKDLISSSLTLDMNNNTAATFTVVNALLDDVEASVADERYDDAENTRLQAYALFDFGPEQRLMAFSPDLAVNIDALFWHGDGDASGLARIIAAQGSTEEFRVVRQELSASLDEAQIILGATSEPLTIILNSAIIVFREGLEAVVIIAALSAGMVRDNKKYRRPLFAGAVIAFIVTGLTWVVADAFLALFQNYGERLEAVVSLVALGVLLVITNWFFHKVYWTDHLAGFHQRKGQLMRGEAGKYLGLMILGFTSIYREGFETVLFLQALVLDAGVLIVLQGVLLGLVGVAVVGFITFKMQTHLPYMKMMVVTGVLIGAVLIMLVGNTVRVMQVVAWLPVHPIEGVNFPYWWGQWFGVYPTWEGILAQIGAAIFVIGSYYLAEYQAAKERREKALRRQAQAAPQANKTAGSH
ncbi:FTR1 family protein [Phototrophicus methaneseepsis]|uniref:FTR1 family protein n=1 Tax=Phototrophicus methaneseepsis TaxID=2710758 RepID=A0A7S8ECI4_9CHLR|nr:FTR1 family protein [Phototrophicus methaneseepsis]QPC84472.1 FTR1 family protein [Phototrophicus methaneseepsis]